MHAPRPPDGEASPHPASAEPRSGSCAHARAPPPGCPLPTLSSDHRPRPVVAMLSLCLAVSVGICLTAAQLRVVQGGRAGRLLGMRPPAPTALGGYAHAPWSSVMASVSPELLSPKDQPRTGRGATGLTADFHRLQTDVGEGGTLPRVRQSWDGVEHTHTEMRSCMLLSESLVVTGTWVAFPRGRTAAVWVFVASPFLQPDQLSVFKVVAFQVIFRNVKDWILNQDTLVA